MRSKTTVAETERLDHRGWIDCGTKPSHQRDCPVIFHLCVSKPRLLGGDTRQRGFLGDDVVAPFETTATLHIVSMDALQRERKRSRPSEKNPYVGATIGVRGTMT